MSIELPGYELVRLLGRGGMAEVHLAVQRSLGREVALKILSPALSDANTRERFLQEARIAAQLRHPHIIAIHDVATHEGTAYIAMEYLAGGTIAPPPGTALDPAQALRIVRDIAGALDYAHGKGVVHRDIKPENILLRDDGRALLSDFGIARITSVESALTREGTSLGTPQYMSPEQLRGDPVDGRSDLYSLGVVLYQLLTGALPFTASDAWALGMQHLGADIPRLPPALAHVQPLVDALMAKEASARPQAGAELVRRIEALGTTTSPTAVLSHLTPPPALSTTGPAISMRNRWWPIAGLALVALAAIGIYQFTKTAPVAAPAAMSPAATSAPAAPVASTQSIAVLPLANESGDEQQQYFSDGLSENLITALSQFEQLKVIGRNSAFQFRDGKTDSKTVGAQLGVAHLLEGSVRRAGDTVRVNVQLIKAADGSTLWSQRYDRPYTGLFALQDEITAAVASELKAKLVDSTGTGAVPQNDRPPDGNLAAYTAFLQSKAAAARFSDDGLRESIAKLEEAIRLSPGYALAHAMLSARLTVTGARFYSGAAAKPVFARARAEAQRALALDPNLAQGHLAHGFLLLTADFDVAGAAAEMAQAKRLAPNDSNTLTQYGNMHTMMGRPAVALESLRRALELDPLQARTHAWLANPLVSLGRFDEAVAAVRRALELQPDGEGWYGQLAVMEAHRGNAAAALALAKQEKPGIDRDIALAIALQVGPDRAAAEAAVQKMITEDSERLGYQIAQAYAARGDADQTFEWLERARGVRDPGVLGVLADPLMLRFRTDPRLADFARKLGLPTDSLQPKT